jgi:hypothetical protein
MLSGANDATTMYDSGLDLDYYLRHERERVLRFLAQEAERNTSHDQTVREWGPRPILGGRIPALALMLCPVATNRPHGRVVLDFQQEDVRYQIYRTRNHGLQLQKEQ